MDSIPGPLRADLASNDPTTTTAAAAASGAGVEAKNTSKGYGTTPTTSLPSTQQQPHARDGEDTKKEPKPRPIPHSKPSTPLVHCLAWGCGASLAIAALFATQRTAVPTFDSQAIGVLFLVTCILALLCPRDKQPQELSAPAKIRFYILSSLEVLATVVMPLVYLMLNRQEQGRPPSNASRIICPHLVAFLAQIAAEAAVWMGGPSRRWLLLPVTALWNAYRIYPLAQASRLAASMVPAKIPSSAMLPPSVATVPMLVHLCACTLWACSSLYFCPFVWWPSYRAPHQKLPPADPKTD
mmetsp:Transcript_45445/g.117741  ORF Transcript_45445/g.117741 Transcript_45445/m.117741 type:complete len:297 (-) Transcript_45445:404-1294(-)